MHDRIITHKAIVFTLIFMSCVCTCQYKDIPVWSVTVGQPEDRVTLLTKIQKRYLVS